MAWEEDKRGDEGDQPMADPRAFSHVVFDLDHTLTYYPVPTAGIVAETFDRLSLSLSVLGSPETIALRYDRLWVELEREAASADELRRAVWRRILSESGLLADGLAERIAAQYGELRRAYGVRLFDGVRDLLADLRAAGYRLGLLTNGLSDTQWEKIRALELGPCFEAVGVAGDLGLYKPDPRAFAALLTQLRAEARRSLFVGDSYDSDIVGAHDAGMATAWIRPAGTPRPGPVVPHYSLVSVLDLRQVIL